MCQGRGSRWSEGLRPGITVPCDYKQLVPVNEIPLIERTLSQVRGVSYTVLIGHGTIYRTYHSHIHTLRDPAGSILDGILRTTNHWENETDVVYLLGDVVYSNYAIFVILSNLYITPPITLYGRLTGNLYTGKSAREIFALHIRPGDDVYNLIKKLNYEKDVSGKLWDVYAETKTIVPVADYTDDVDSPEEYAKFFRELERRARFDDESN